jgi:hypothetical protein
VRWWLYFFEQGIFLFGQVQCAQHAVRAQLELAKHSNHQFLVTLTIFADVPAGPIAPDFL